MSQRTPLYERHESAGARLVDFGGWRMPLHYGSQVEEHHAVRQGAGVFDVSHMTVLDIHGADAKHFLRHLLANDVARLQSPGRGLYSCMLNEAGGVVDDLIVYRRGPQQFRMVVNAATREKDLQWIRTRAADQAVHIEERKDTVMLAVQGPRAMELAAPLLPAAQRAQALALQNFGCCEAEGWFIARTGYTGESGWELILDDAAAARQFWDALLAAGVRACGLGARDTLRLEAGLALYGQDLDEEHSPLTSGLAWTVAWEPAERNFCGRAALQAERDSGVTAELAGLVLTERGIMRHGQRVISSQGDGVITSGGFSPTLGCSIAMARVPAGAAGHCEVEIRSANRRAKLVKPVFVRNGKKLLNNKDA